MATVKRTRRRARLGVNVLAGSALALSAFDWPAASPRRRRPPCPAITGAPAIHGTRAGRKLRTGTGIAATTGNVREARMLRPAGVPGARRRGGRRRSHLHRRGHPGPTSCGTRLPMFGDFGTAEYGLRSERPPTRVDGWPTATTPTTTPPQPLRDNHPAIALEFCT